MMYRMEIYKLNAICKPVRQVENICGGEYSLYVCSLMVVLLSGYDTGIQFRFHD